MKNYKLTDSHPFTYTQLVAYCSNFFKKSFSVKLIAQAIEKDASLEEKALMCNKPKNFYRDEILTVMGQIDPAFKTAQEQYEAKVKKEKEWAGKEPERKLLNMLFVPKS
jgi:hypothetical protein